ncbi:MAG: hypothetical protein IKW98_03650 [Prevotella sp.]|nr:hypothetical protein [Prevotella sp.]
MKNEAIIKSIQCLLDEYKTEKAKPSLNKADLGSLRYLLLQSIRQYDIPAVNHHLSQAAHSRWTELTTANIMNYHYRDIVVCDNLSKPVQHALFNGSKKRGTLTTLTKGSKFHFREMFHEDHVIPVSMILDEMIEMQTINYASVEELLNKMHICVILKKEDRKIGRTKGRSLSFQETIKEVYTGNISLYP